MIGKCRYCGTEAMFCEELMGFVCWACHIKLAKIFNDGFSGKITEPLFANKEESENADRPTDKV